MDKDREAWMDKDSKTNVFIDRKGGGGNINPS
jgi:hypothetical protein